MAKRSPAAGSGPVRAVTVQERRARLGRRQQLARSGRATDPVQCAADLVALHATDPSAPYLAARARIDGLTQAAVDAALYDDRTLVRMLGMRRTMFVVPTASVPVVQHSSSDAVAAREWTRMVKALDGVVPRPAQWLIEVCDSTVDALRTAGPALAQQLSEREPRLKTQLVGPPDKSYGGPTAITSQVLNLLSAQSRIVRGRPTHGWASSRYRWEVVETWLPHGVPELEVADARAELLYRWLSRFGPAPLTDLVWWTGWNQRDTLAALHRLDLVEVDLAGVTGLLLADDVDQVTEPEPWIAFLPALDPTPMGWKAREWYLPESHRQRLFDTFGNIGPTIWCDGRIVGGWAQGPAADVRFELLENVGRERLDQIATEADALTAWHAGVRVIPRFRTPLERQLAG